MRYKYSFILASIVLMNLSYAYPDKDIPFVRPLLKQFNM
jgi:hypothetical protein